MGAGAAQKKSGGLIVACDELWRFVRNKREQWWIWVALDADTRQVVGRVAGGRSAFTARCLWDALPDAYRGGAGVHTDVWSAYLAAVPAEGRVAAGKGDGRTDHVERLWCTLRQRCARVVRKTRSFPECEWNHVGALWYFIRHDNASLL